MRVPSGFLFALGLVAIGCSDGTGPGGDQGRIGLALATAGSSQNSPALAAPESHTLGGTTLILTRVQLVLREIELERAETSTDCGDETPVGAEDDCEEFETGPLLIDLPLNGAIEQLITIDADSGTFDELEFVVHKPEDDAEHAAFLSQHPDFEGVSIRVEGTWNGTPFVFTTDLDVEQEMDLAPPLQILGGGASTQVTLLVDLRRWFLNGEGTAFVDPATGNKGGSNESLVKENIKQSFEAFEDHDSDGEPDA